MVVVARFLWVHNKPGKDQADAPTDYSADPIQHQTSLLSRERPWTKLFTPKRERGHWVPTISGIIKAGDEGVYSSTLFNALHGHPGELPLDAVHEAFANELRARPMTERSAYPSEISKFLSTSKKLRRGQSVKTTKDGRPEMPPRASRNSIDLSELGLGRSRSTRRTAPNLISTFNVLPFESGGPMPAHGRWTQELQHAQYFEGRTGVTVTPRELAALSLVLGSHVEFTSTQKVNRNNEQESSTSKGAFGISISASKAEKGNYRISLTQHKRKVARQPARGSGFSTLHAKHLASGSLPFSSDRKTINTIIITNETLEALKTGTRLHLSKHAANTKGSQFLASLPSSRELSFHVLAPSSTSTSTPRLLHAIAELPFTGGLTPLATLPIIQTVQFVASGGLVPGRLLQRLDALVEKVHRHAPHLQLFGPLLEDRNAGLLFRERERLGKLATGSPSVDDSLADKVARMHRYITLLERLMCLIPDMKPSDVLAAVREATKKEMERSYEEAVSAHLNPAPVLESTVPNRRHSGISRRGTKRASKRWSFPLAAATQLPTPSISASTTPPLSQTQSPADSGSPRASSTFPTENLGRRVEGLLKGGLPCDVQSVALVARMVVVVWTLSVGTVAWEENEEGFRVLDGSKLPEKMSLW